jgi:hypothetical protein
MRFDLMTMKSLLVIALLQVASLEPMSAGDRKEDESGPRQQSI